MLLPGKPEPSPQALTTGIWQRKRFTAYISGTSISILLTPTTLLQTLYAPSPLISLAFDPSSGTIAAASATELYLFRPNSLAPPHLKWSLQHTLTPPGAPLHSLSFSPTSSELLCGGGSLSIWSTTPLNIRMLWSRELANPAKTAIFSPDAMLVASVAENDRLVKIWRRIVVGGPEDSQWDFSYLPHPRAVVSMRWRQTDGEDGEGENVLYTLSRDGVLRIWAPVWPHDVHLLQLWASIDIRGNAAPGPDGEEKVFVIDSRIMRQATERAVAIAGEDEKGKASLQRLTEVAGTAPEIVIGFDGEGKVSAWGVENVGCKARRTTNVFPILQREDAGLRILGTSERTRFKVFADGDGLVVLVHQFDGRIYWLEARIDRLLDPHPTGRRFEVKGMWSGHSGAVRKLVRTTDGTTLLTSTDDNDLYVWKKREVGGQPGLVRRSLLQSEDRVRRAVIFRDGRYIMTQYPDAAVLWDTRHEEARVMQKIPFKSRGKVLTMLVLPEDAASAGSEDTYHVVSVDAELGGTLWEVKLPGKDEVDGQSPNGHPPVHMKEISSFTLPSKCKVLQMIPVDPVGWTAVLSEKLDIFSREVATTVCESGLIQSWTVKFFKEDKEVRWLATSSVQTGIKSPALAKASSSRKVAVVDSSRHVLSIWDSRAGHLEFEKTFEGEDKIQDLDWTSTPQGQSILSLGFAHKVILFCQLRYDYLDAGPAWAPFREMDLSKMTPHPIGDSTWLHDGSLVIGSGNQLFLYPRKIEEVDPLLESLHLSSHKTDKQDLFNIVNELNGPLPVYHPQFLQQCILTGKNSLVETILLKLYKELRSYHEEIGLEPLLGIPAETFYEPVPTPRPARRMSRIESYYDGYVDEAVESDVVDEELGLQLCELIQSIAIPHLTGTEQIALVSIVESVAQAHKDRRSMDENAGQYLVFFRQHLLRREKRPVSLTFREFKWAFHSNSQDILVDIVNRSSQGKLLWPQAREAGLFMWLRDPEALKREFEKLARNHYTMKDEKDPVDCSLYYLALKKKKVLQGLWRIATWHREQPNTHKFLSNDFTQPKWRTAAMKNAYALMGKHRFEYAAAFFLLADSLHDALNVLFNQMKDPQLAIAVARVYEGSDDSPILHKFIETKILPHCVETSNRWFACYAFWLLNKRDLAVQSLVVPLETLITGAPAPELRNRLFVFDDPALIIFYEQIREKTSSTLRGANKVTPEQEFKFVLHTASLYDRMGCDLLALDLVRNWNFLSARDEIKPLIERSPVRERVMRRRSSVILDEPVRLMSGLGVEEKVSMGIGGQGEREKKEEDKKPQPTMFVEPDMSWMF